MGEGAVPVKYLDDESKCKAREVEYFGHLILDSPEGAPKKEHDPEKMNENNKKRILVVDDHPKVLAFIAIDLELRGFGVSTATSGEEALKKVDSENPDIILLDILMPGMSGFEVLQKLRPSTDIPVIAFSASPENQEPAIRAGANMFIHKPFDPDDMAKKIGELVG